MGRGYPTRPHKQKSLSASELILPPTAVEHGVPVA